MSVSAPLPVTVLIPVKNEECNLPACLARLDGFEDIVVVDSQSADDTVRLAEEGGARVVQFCWNGRYPKKRNWALQTLEFNTPWVLFLDADELVTPEFKDELKRALADTDRVGFWLRYENAFLGGVLKHGVEQRKLALIRVGAGFYERIEDDRWSSLDMEVHEHPVLDGQVGEIRAQIEHRDDRGLHHYIARHNDYSSWEARRFLALRNDPATWSTLTLRQRLKYSCLSHWWFSLAYFVGTYLVKRGFLDGWPGLVHATLKMHYFFQVYCKIHAWRRAEAERPSAG